MPEDLPGSSFLILAPHPDDESIGCGGSIVKHVRGGNKVKVIFLTAGNMGDPLRIFAGNYINLRRASALKALSVLGVADYSFWEFGDRQLSEGIETLYRKIREEVEQSNPDIVYVPSPYEIHPDHRAACRIGLRLLREMKINIVFYEVLIPLYPNRLVDITREFRVKEAAIQCYHTELYYNNYLYITQGLDRCRTATLPKNVKYAEAFIYCRSGSKENLSETIYPPILNGTLF